MSKNIKHLFFFYECRSYGLLNLCTVKILNLLFTHLRWASYIWRLLLCTLLLLCLWLVFKSGFKSRAGYRLVVRVRYFRFQYSKLSLIWDWNFSTLNFDHCIESCLSHTLVFQKSITKQHVSRKGYSKTKIVFKMKLADFCSRKMTLTISNLLFSIPCCKIRWELKRKNRLK